MKKVLLLVALMVVGGAFYTMSRGDWAQRNVDGRRGATERGEVAGAEPASSPAAGPMTISQRGPGMRRQGPASLDLPVPRTFDLTHVEPQHFATALGNDPVRIFNWVRDEIAYECTLAACVVRGARFWR